MRDPDRELVEQVIGEGYFPLLAHLVLLVLLLVLAWGDVPRPLVLGWAGLIIGVSVARLAVWRWARRRALATRAMTRIVRATMLLLGLTWGVGAALAIPYLPSSDAALVLLGLTGLLAGGLTTLVADQWSFPIYAIAMFVPLVIVIGLVGAGLFDEMGVVLIIIYIAFTIRLHRQSYYALRNQLRVESELRAREHQLAAAQSIAHVGSWEWDLATNAVVWSDELRRMYGLSGDAPAGYAEFLARAHPDDRKRLEELVAQTLSTSQSVDYEWRCIRPDGEVRYIQGRNVIIKNSTGEAVRMAGTSLDITDRKHAEAELKVLRGILPICASCKRIHNGDGTWEAVESYVRQHTHAEFTHGLCPDCAARDWGTATG